MSSSRTIKRAPETRPSQKADEAVTTQGPEVKLIAEDGWVFIERPGKGIECVRRFDAAELEVSSQPNLVRHRYPSN